MRRGNQIVFKDSNKSSYLEVNTEFHLKFYCSDFQKDSSFWRRIDSSSEGKNAAFQIWKTTNNQCQYNLNMRSGYSTAISDFIESSLNTEFYLKFYCSDFPKRCIILEKDRFLSGRNKIAPFKSEKPATTDVNITCK